MEHFGKAAGNFAALHYASDLLYGFDIQDDESQDFLASLIATGQVPDAELKQITGLALLGGKEEWDMLLACASAIRTRALGKDRPDPGLAPCLAYVLSGRAATDERADPAGDQEKTVIQRRKSAPRRTTSRFWEDERAVKSKSDSALKGARRRNGGQEPPVAVSAERSSISVTEHPVSPAKTPPEYDPSSLLETAPEDAGLQQADEPASSPPSPSSPFPAHYHSPLLKRSRSFTSPFFTPSPAKKKYRPPRGTISSLPFPPLSAPRFGLVQESLSHDPFRLLVAVTFLIRTTGKAAIPVYRRVVERFPTPRAFLDADLEAELVPMIAHLGLPAVRCAAIGKYARIWTERPPEAGVRFVVRGYPRLAIQRTEEEVGGQDVEGSDEKEAEDGEGQGSGDVRGDDRSGADDGVLTAEEPGQRKRTRSKLKSSEWEIGHLTQGRYAIDSWRIFCRDIFLGKSNNWMAQTGGNEAPEERAAFEPEWMRVLPEDKELRACLRWMWMREGFEWDPVTGEKSPLREEMRAAVEEGRVKYDDMGQLVTLEGPLDSDGG